jgi:hypothetical protein
MSPTSIRHDRGSSELGQQPQLGFDLSQQRRRQITECPSDAIVVYGSALIDHDLTVLRISSDSTRKLDAKYVSADESSRTRKNPSRGMRRIVE